MERVANRQNNIFKKNYLMNNFIEGRNISVPLIERQVLAVAFRPYTPEYDRAMKQRYEAGLCARIGVVRAGPVHAFHDFNCDRKRLSNSKYCEVCSTTPLGH